MRKSGRTDWPGLGGKRERIKRHAATQQKISIKPMIRVAQAKPTDGKSRCNARGNMTPPSDPPAAAMPVALPRFSWKKWLTAAKAGVKIRDVPKPPSTPNTRKNCQYFVQIPKRRLDVQIKMLPASTSRRGPWASKIGPICSPQKKDKKTYIENIQLMVLSV